MDIYEFCSAVVAQDAPKLRQFFHRDAVINWPCTNERFTVEEYIAANCEYPGSWDGEVERVETLGEIDHRRCKRLSEGQERILPRGILHKNRRWKNRLHG